MDSKRLLVIMAERLYDDIRFVTQQSPTQIVDDDGARAYNLLLAKSRKYYPTIEFLPDFSDWMPRTIKYKDALVASGQLFALLKAASEAGDDLARMSRPAAPPAQPAQNSAASQSASSTQTSTSSFRGAPPSVEGANRESAAESRRSSSQFPGITTTAPPLSSSTPHSSPAHAPQTPAPPKPIIPRRPMSPAPPPPPVSSPGSRGGMEDLHDSELYGSQPVSKRREDGTIPFTME